MGVWKPTANGNGVLGVEDIWGRRIVDNDCFSEVAANLGEIFDVVTLVIVATLSEKTMVYHVVNI